MKKHNKKAKKKAIFRVFCNFYVEAIDLKEAKDMVLDVCNNGFYEAHIQIKPGKCSKDFIWASDKKPGKLNPYTRE